MKKHTEAAQEAEVREALGNVSLCSNLMRTPQVFDQYGPSVSGVARDLAIWSAWNGAKHVTLNVRQFAKMFGYSTAFLFKRVSEEQAAELKRSKYGPEFKDTIGYALAKMQLQNLVFPEAVQYVATDEQGAVRKYKTLTLIRNLTSETTKRGTSYRFEVSATFLGNCRKRYQTFNLDTYLLVSDHSGKAWSGGRKMYLHLCWKRKVWNAAKKEKGVRPSVSKYDELIDVAGFKYGQENRNAHALRVVMDDLAHLPGVGMSAEVEKDYQTEQYSVTFKRHEITATA